MSNETPPPTSMPGAGAGSARPDAGTGQDRPDPFAPAPPASASSSPPPAEPNPPATPNPWAPTAPIPPADTPGSPTPGAGGPPTAAVPSPAPPPVGPPAQPRRASRAPLIIGGAVVALVAGLIGGAVGASTSGEESTSSAPAASGSALPAPDTSPVTETRPPESIAGVAAQVLPGVTTIRTQTGSGSGFLISDEGYVLTNYHVIQNPGGPIVVRFEDGREQEAELVGASPSYDLAVLRVDPGDAPPLTLGSSQSMVPGDPVVAVGSPLDLAGTVTLGIISAVDRPVTAGGRGESSYISALQTDAAINPGNSGGPLVDLDGRVVGINSAIATLGTNLGGQSGSIGLGFSIPIDQASVIAEEIIATGEATFPVIGASLDIQDVDGGPGALVADVVPGGPADEAGLRAGDRITELNDERVLSSEELIVGIREGRPGDTVTLTYERGPESTTIDVVTDAAVG
jgi:putative serine protease PepD